MLVEFQQAQATCFRCGWKWAPRIAMPRRCPRCLSYAWNEPKPEARANPTTKEEPEE